MIPLLKSLLAIIACFVLIGVSHASQLEANIVDSNGKPLADAVVYLAPKQAAPPVAAAKLVTIDQVDKEFVPRVSVIQTGASVRFPNRDNIRHQVYSFSPAKVFTLKLYSGTPSDPVVIDKSGLVVLGCNIHDHMVAWVLSVDTPWFGKADASGRASVAGVPAGQYELLAWQSSLTKPVSQGEVQFDGSNKLDRKVILQVVAPAAATPVAARAHDHGNHAGS